MSAPVPPSHASVLYHEVLDALHPRPHVGFMAIDATGGAGGHAQGVLERSTPDGRVLVLDADPDALTTTGDRLKPFADRATVVHANFRDLQPIATQHAFQRVDAVVFDLGLSSPQLDTSGRGFSFRFDEPLDMRFDPSSDESTAADLLNSSTEAELETMLKVFGEEPRARRLARVIVQRRQRAPFARTGDLVAAVTQALGPSRGRIHPATRAFQAVRIAVNDELATLEQGLDAARTLLKPGGRLVVISFHSLEDRIVKWRFRGWADQGLVQVITRKPIVPSADEQRANPRARSAKLRVAEAAT